MSNQFKHTKFFSLPIIQAAGLVMFFELIVFGVVYVPGFKIYRECELTGTILKLRKKEEEK